MTVTTPHPVKPTAKRVSAQDMHKIVLTLVGVFVLVALSYPIAMLRVANMEKFRGLHVKPLTATYQPVALPQE